MQFARVQSSGFLEIARELLPASFPVRHFGRFCDEFRYNYFDLNGSSLYFTMVYGYDVLLHTFELVKQSPLSGIRCFPELIGKTGLVVNK